MTRKLTIVCFASQPWEVGMWTNGPHLTSRTAKPQQVLKARR